MSIKAIVAIEQNNAIGYKNELLCRNEKDLKLFKEKTLYCPILMGYNTYKSLNKPLSKRLNILYNPRSQQNNILDNLVLEINNIQDCLKMLNKFRVSWIIGGAKTYKDFEPYIDELHITIFNENCENYDTIFPINYKDEKKWQNYMIEGIEYPYASCYRYRKI